MILRPPLKQRLVIPNLSSLGKKFYTFPFFSFVTDLFLWFSGVEYIKAFSMFFFIEKWKSKQRLVNKTRKNSIDKEAGEMCWFIFHILEIITLCLRVVSGRFFTRSTAVSWTTKSVFFCVSNEDKYGNIDYGSLDCIMSNGKDLLFSHIRKTISFFTSDNDLGSYVSYLTYED